MVQFQLSRRIKVRLFVTPDMPLAYAAGIIIAGTPLGARGLKRGFKVNARGLLRVGNELAMTRLEALLFGLKSFYPWTMDSA
jgi:hypothetical protein